jgi:hypothetical protein
MSWNLIIGLLLGAAAVAAVGGGWYFWQMWKATFGG